jgi:hypothetical protein
MATSSTNTFNLDIGEIVDEAFDRAGMEARTGWHYKTARRSLDLMMLEWQNRGLNLWTVSGPTSQTLTAGTGSYTLDSSGNTVDLIEYNLRTNDGDSGSQTDYTLRRISIPEYADFPNKLTESQPTQILINRNTSSLTVDLLPVPDDSQTYKLIYYSLRLIYDSGSPASYNMDVPKLFLPALAAGLAYYVAMKFPMDAADRLPFLKQEYEQQFNLAADENRVKAPIRFVPSQTYS